QLGGNVELDWRPSGLLCTLAIPVGPSMEIPQGGGQNLVKLPTGAMRRVLLAEDEAIIGLMMRDFLSEFGLFVVGPYCTLNETLAAAEGEFDCAILDLNLGGETIYPVAQLLLKRNVPFAFVTGYGRESIDQQFSDVPMLQKPVTRENLENHLHNLLEPHAAQAVKQPGNDGVRSSSSALTA